MPVKQIAKQEVDVNSINVVTAYVGIARTVLPTPAIGGQETDLCSQDQAMRASISLTVSSCW